MATVCFPSAVVIWPLSTIRDAALEWSRGRTTAHRPRADSPPFGEARRLRNKEVLGCLWQGEE